MGITAAVRILDLFLSDIGHEFSLDEIQTAADIHDFTRTIRSLRQNGWQIRGPVRRNNTTYYAMDSPERSEGHIRNSISQKVKHKILRKYKRCCVCGKGPDVSSLEVDHIRPIELNGTSEPYNLWVLCRECNHLKKDFYDDTDRKEIFEKKTSTERLVTLFLSVPNGTEISPVFIATVAGVRDWPRAIRNLRQEKKISYEYDRKKDTYITSRKGKERNDIDTVRTTEAR